MRTIFDNHRGYFTSDMNPAPMRQSNSLPIAFCQFGANFLSLYFTGHASGWKLRWCCMTSGLTLGMYSGHHASTSAFSLKKLTSCIWLVSGNAIPTLTTLSGRLVLRGTSINYSIGSRCAGALKSFQGSRGGWTDHGFLSTVTTIR